MAQHPEPGPPEAVKTAHVAMGTGDVTTEQMLLLESRHSQQCTRCLGARFPLCHPSTVKAPKGPAAGASGQMTHGSIGWARLVLLKCLPSKRVLPKADHTRAVFLNWGSPQRTFGIVWRQFWLSQNDKWEAGVLLASSEQRPGLLLSTLQHAGQPPATEKHGAPNVNSAMVKEPL